MADEDEIDVLGDFSFNSCFAQNRQGIPSCSNREDTVHPQWMLDSNVTNWYDIENKNNNSDKIPTVDKKTYYSAVDNDNNSFSRIWTQKERDILVNEMKKYGRNFRKIAESLKTKTEAEIQALIEAEHGINLETPSFGLDKNEGHADVPVVVQEEIVTDESTHPQDSRLTQKKLRYKRKHHNIKSQRSLLKPDNMHSKSDTMEIDPDEEDFILGSTESLGSDVDLPHIVSKNIEKCKVKSNRKLGNHRRKMSGGNDKNKFRSKSKELTKSPQGRQRKDSSLSEDSMKSPKMQIVLGSGQALPVSEGEQVIKIEKKKDSEPESDIEVDIDSDIEASSPKSNNKNDAAKSGVEETLIAVPLRKFEPMPKRLKKINLDGGGGYTIMHTDSGDLYEIAAEPKKERAPRKQPVHLIQCRIYNSERPAPFEVRIYVSTLISMDAHAHTSRGEVMGLVGGAWSPAGLVGGRAALSAVSYRRAAAASGSTHCDMDPVSQSAAAEWLRSQGLAVCAWHHSHPTFPAAPSAQDLRTQRALQLALEWSHVPFLGFITSQHWPTGRTASQYRCIRVEEDEDSTRDVPVGYQFSVKLVADLTQENLPLYLEELASILCDCDKNSYSVDMPKDICPQAKMTYLDKCISSINHHLRSAGYADDDPVVHQLVLGVRDIFR